MTDFLSFTTLGVIQGMTYGIIALGMVLIYKGSRTLNFAQPFMGLYAAYFCWYMTGTPGAKTLGVGLGLETAPGFIKWLRYPLVLFPFEIGTRPRLAIAVFWALAFIVFVGYRLERDLFRLLEKAPRLVNLVATIALINLFLGGISILFERTEKSATAGKALPVLLPQSISFNVGHFPVTAGYIQILIVVPIVAGLAAAYFKFTKFGVAVRASAENREAAQLLGISARRVSSFTWMSGAFLAGLAALLIVPAQGSLTVFGLGFGLLVRSLAAALVGGLTSLPGAFVGGIVVGIAEFLTRWRTATIGVPEFVFFGIVIAVLIFRPGGIFGRRQEIEDVVSFIPAIRDLPSRLSQLTVSRRARWTFVVVGICLVSAVSLATGPFTNGVLTNVLVYGIVGVALTVLIGYAGQISLGHWALTGVGAFAAGDLFDRLHVPFWLVFPCVIVIGMVVALVIGLPAVRIRGPYLAVVTVAFALAAYEWIFRLDFLAHGTTGSILTPPKFGRLDFGSETNRPVFFFGFACFLLCAWVAYNFKRSRTGRGFFSLRENEKAAATFGVELTRYRLIAFMLSGGMASLAGAVYALRAGTGGVTALDFPAIASLLLVAMVIIGGLGSIIGSVLGALLLFGASPLLEGALGTAVWVPYVVSAFAGGALIVTLTRARAGLAGLFFLPRDPVVQGLVWHDDERRTSPNGERRARAPLAETRELPVAAPGRKARPARAARR